jgi:hypothetical protein
MADQKKRGEFLHVAQVLAHLYPTENITPQASESPDWLLLRNDKKIGIEVTEMPDDELRPVEGNERKLLERASSVADSRGLRGASVNIQFTRDRLIPNSEIRGIAEGLVDLAVQSLSEFPNEINDVPPTNPLCQDIDTIGVFSGNPTKVWKWQALRSNSPKDLLAWQIQDRIREKQPKLERYSSKCSECWLILGADGYKGSTYFRPGQRFGSVKYTTSFDRLFFVSSVHNEVIELNKRAANGNGADA